MTSRIPAWLAAPLLAAFAVLRVAASSPGQYTAMDLAITVGTVVVVAAAIAAAVHVAAARIGASRRTMGAFELLLAAAIALFFWGVPLVLAPLDVSGLPLSARYTVVVGFLAIALLVGVAWSRGSTFVVPARVITTASILLVAGACVRLFIQELTLRHRLARDPLISAVMQPVAVSPSFHKSPDGGAQRDIYLLILDSRANAAVLQDDFGYDDSAFTDSLRTLGFVIPAGFHSNYLYTAQSLPSLLNFTHANRVRGTDGNLAGTAIARALLQRNRSAAFLKAQGYRYRLFPSEWYGLTASSPLADETFRATPLWDVRQVLGTEFRRALFQGTPVMRLPSHADPTSHARASFAGLKGVPDDPRPTFVLAHFLLPHPPYVFAEDCSPRRGGPPRDIELEKRLYLQQLRCTNELVLDAVTEILARSKPRPIIAIVGDHGSRVTPFTMDEEVPGSIPALQERFGAFGAFLTPDAPQNLFSGELTLVNVMQRLLTTYFGAEIAPQADRFFAAPETHTFDFQEIPREIATGMPP